MNPWGLRGGRCRVLVPRPRVNGAHARVPGAPGPAASSPHSSFVVRNQETDAGEPALGLRGRPGWLQGRRGLSPGRRDFALTPRGGLGVLQPCASRPP